MRKALTALIASTGLLLGLGVAMPVSASAQGHAFNPYVIPADAQYICDGASQGDCASLPVEGRSSPTRTCTQSIAAAHGDGTSRT